MTDYLLRAENIVVDFPVAGGTLRAVNHVSFTLREHEILGIVGESGSGKSTLGNVIAGFLPPTRGTYFVDGQQQYASARSVRRSRGSRVVQMIFQNSTTALNPRMDAITSVAEAIAAGGRITTSHRRAALAYMERVGLAGGHGARRPDQLSGGQRQRVAIARALAAQPRALVCDEAVSALDVSARARILNLLMRIRRDDGTAMVFISHDLSVVSQLVDRVMVMNHGNVVEEGPVKQVIHDPQDPYTKELLAAIPRLERTSVTTSAAGGAPA